MPKEKIQPEILKLLEAFLSDYLEDLESTIADIVKKILTEELQKLLGIVNEKAKPGLKGEDSKIPGPKGDEGNPGYTPIKGKDYFDGHDADETKIVLEVLSQIPPAKPGLPGKDGTEIEGEQIVSKINALEIVPEKQIDFVHLKNVPEFGKVERGKVLRGGMEQIRWEDLSSQIDGVVTSFTTTASFVEVQAIFSSQFPLMLRPTVHYTTTPSIRTITMNVSLDIFQPGQSLIVCLRLQ